jgi:hypothetical protein
VILRVRGGAVVVVCLERLSRLSGLMERESPRGLRSILRRDSVGRSPSRSFRAGGERDRERLVEIVETESEEPEENDRRRLRPEEGSGSRLRLRLLESSSVRFGRLSLLVLMLNRICWASISYAAVGFVAFASAGGSTADSFGANLGLRSCWLREGRAAYGLSCCAAVHS